MVGKVGFPGWDAKLQVSRGIFACDLVQFGACWQHSGKVKTALYGKGILTNLLLSLSTGKRHALQYTTTLKIETKRNSKVMSGK